MEPQFLKNATPHEKLTLKWLFALTKQRGCSSSFQMQEPQFLKWSHNFWKTPHPTKKRSPWPPKKGKMRSPKKVFPRIHYGMDILQKTRSNLVYFGLWSLISDLPPPIGGPHPVLYFPSQIQRNIVQRCATNYLPQKRQSYIGYICLVFLHCAFSNVSSNFLPENRQSRIGCICWTFFHCAFSNVFSKRLPENRHSHTGYICLAFLHCALPDASSNGLPEKMQSYIGCICLTFPHYRLSNVDSKSLDQSRHSHIDCTFDVFSNVLSKRLHEKMHNHTGCICLIFLHCVFLNVSSSCFSQRMHTHIGCTCMIFLHRNLCFSRDYLPWPPLTKVIIYKILIHHHKVGNVVPCVLSVSNWKKWVEDKWKWESFLNIISKIIIEDNQTWYLSATPRECKQFQVSVLIHTQRVVLYTLHIVCNFTHCV